MAVSVAGCIPVYWSTARSWGRLRPVRRPKATTELVTVLFTDVVASTEIAAEVGDRRWRELVAAHHALVRRALKRHLGRELDTAWDGFFAVFHRPADAIRCANEVSEDVRELGLEIRAASISGRPR